jgi:DNA-binding transcriptional regulator LsrR (DeoR family)
MTQSEVAERLGVSTTKAHRLIAAANRSGAVKVTVEGDVIECVLLEQRLMECHGLDLCEVVPDLGEEGLPLRALGAAGATILGREIARRPAGAIGLGNGRTLAAAVDALARQNAAEVRFVSLLGGLTRSFAANPHDVMHRLAERTGATAYVMPVPFVANTAEDRDVLLAQRGVGEVRALAQAADLMLAGIGSVDNDAQLVEAGVIDAGEIAEVRAAGGVGELLGHFFDAEGARVETGVSERTVSPSLDAIRGTRAVALAGGASKIAAIRAVLASGCLSGLVTDERTARALG